MSPAGVKLRNLMLRRHEIVKLAASIYIDKMNNVTEMLLLILMAKISTELAAERMKRIWFIVS